MIGVNVHTSLHPRVHQGTAPRGLFLSVVFHVACSLPPRPTHHPHQAHELAPCSPPHLPAPARALLHGGGM